MKTTIALFACLAACFAALDCRASMSGSVPINREQAKEAKPESKPESKTAKPKGSKAKKESRPVKADVTVGPEHDGKTVSLKVGQVLAVRLPGNPTTGYVWKVAELEGEGLVAVGEPSYVQTPPAKAQQVGGGGAYTAQFRAAEEGSCVVRLEYGRPWEKEPGKTYSVTVEVKPAAGKPAKKD